MAKGTPILFPPTVDEVISAGREHSLPALECMKFHAHYEANGWKVGKNRMVSLNGALRYWSLCWRENNGHVDGNGERREPVGKLSGADKMICQKELERVLARMKLLENSYDSHAEMQRSDLNEYRALKQRRAELKKLLGVMI